MRSENRVTVLGSRLAAGDPPLAERLHKLAALRLLDQSMHELEQQRQHRIDRGDDPADVDRQTAQAALGLVLAFFHDHGIESWPLARLLSELAALTAGASPSRMLAPAVTRHRRPDAPAIEGIKGRLAAIMECRQKAGLTRKADGEWVVRHTPAKLKRRLGLDSRATVDSWLVKWGGQRGTVPGSGRAGYLHVRAILEQGRVTEAQLKKIMAALETLLAA
jgi:hypothetical protein